jgi:hypothetical protein
MTVKEAKPGTVSPNAFAGQKTKPTEKSLASVLGPSLPLWKNLVAELKSDLKTDIAEWHTGSVKLGWSLRLQLKKRNIVYLGPRDGWFVAAFALGDRAVAAALASEIPVEVRTNLAGSKRYAEGTAVRIEVRTQQDAGVVKQLAKIKVEN